MGIWVSFWPTRQSYRGFLSSLLNSVRKLSYLAEFKPWLITVKMSNSVTVNLRRRLHFHQWRQIPIAQFACFHLLFLTEFPFLQQNNLLKSANSCVVIFFTTSVLNIGSRQMQKMNVLCADNKLSLNSSPLWYSYISRSSTRASCYCETKTGRIGSFCHLLDLFVTRRLVPECGKKIKPSYNPLWTQIVDFRYRLWHKNFCTCSWPVSNLTHVKKDL